ncbi:MAG: hypothetical protein PHY69_09830 [Dysgonamonadaceae bacterium]|jgi:hypothetical protein|nr:hypothetical protein [Dysgonamonadaceae bacterium]MDD3310240.1 hypothetical protein [Dysgonamonadaceae bacterium]MDD3900210.1 hypothetical protein [Dysgonamonadaceae bacterium]MDD4398501.1 hypothetical protein [Dysgonamonadaceae bacterium]
MKKIFFLLIILLPTLVFSQENIRRSAEDFVIEYFKLFEEKQWDAIPNMYAKDAQVIWLNRNVLPLLETMKPILDKNKTEMTGEKIDVKWILTDVMGTNTAMVYTRYLETTNRLGQIRVTDNMGVFQLEQINGEWKIKKWIPSQNFPLIFNQNIDEKYQMDNMATIAKAGFAIQHGWNILFYNLEYFNKAGTTPAELGRMMGARFAETWDKTKGFEGLANGFIWGLQIMSTYVEVLERNETTFVAKIAPPNTASIFDFTKEDLFICCQNIWSEIADYMGGNCTLENQENYWIITLKKK